MSYAIEDDFSSSPVYYVDLLDDAPTGSWFQGYYKKTRDCSFENIFLLKNGSRASLYSIEATYQLVEERERTFSLFRRVRRIMLGVILTIVTLGLAYSDFRGELFSKSKEKIYVALKCQNNFAASAPLWNSEVVKSGPFYP